MIVELDDYTAQQLERLAIARGALSVHRLANEVLGSVLAGEIHTAERIATARRNARAARIVVDHG